MDATYFDRSYHRSVKVRWISKFLKYSGFMEVEGLRELINDKIARIEKRKGELDDIVVCKITENLLWAKVAKKYLDRRIRAYTPKSSSESPTHHFRSNGFTELPFSFRDSEGAIFKERHWRLRKSPSILMPGFLPDGNEAFFLLRKCFLKFGSVYYFNYPTSNFYKETIFYQLYDTIVEINKKKLKTAGQKEAPFLVGTSFGGHMIITFLKWLREKGLYDKVRIRGLILISPVLSIADLVDPALERQKTLVGRAVAHLCEADRSDPVAVRKSMQKAKNILMKMFTSGRDLMNFEAKKLIPIFAIEDDVLNIFRQSEDSDDGYFDRFMELRAEPSIDHKFLSDLPTLVLFAEGEGDVMTPEAPTMSAFAKIDNLKKIFPNGAVEFVHSGNDKRKVTHSDLIFQADRFVAHLEPWLIRVSS